jgi:hypothetical protein
MEDEMSNWERDVIEEVDKGQKTKVIVYFRKIRVKNYKYIDKKGTSYSISLWLYVISRKEKKYRYYYYAIEAITSMGKMIGHYDSKWDKNVKFKTAEDAKTAVMGFYKIWLPELNNVIYKPK